MKVLPCVAKMTNKQLRQYTFSYISEDFIDDFLQEKFGDFCETCIEYHYEADVNSGDCVAGGLLQDENCVCWYRINYYLQMFITADLMLRDEFGDDVNEYFASIERHTNS